ncbi:DUF1592 domain-containing protein [Paraglaciecola sp.]|uniref:DUF1592 domain-containing protein n=1 Tax=Paraglaciecola sp. TaxID=1920173 RepID=UPI003EF0ED64
MIKPILITLSFCLVMVSQTQASADKQSISRDKIISLDKLDTLKPNVVKFVSKYCLDCHNSETTKGDRNFLEFLTDPEHEDNQIIMEEMLDQLNIGMMPEEKEGVPAPSNEEISTAIDQMTDYLTIAYEKEKPIETPLRKLSKIEYVNSLRDLLLINPVTSGAVSKFPKDPNIHGFTNISSHQNLSKDQLNLYLTAATENIDRAIAFDKEEPSRKNLTIRPENFAKTEKFNNNGVFYRVLDRRKKYIDIGHGQLNERHPTYGKKLGKRGVHEDGTYTISVNAMAIGRQNPYDKKIVKHNLNDYMKLAIAWGENINSLQPSTQSGRHLIKVFDLADNQAQDYSVTTWLPKGAIPYFYWINGPGSSKNIVTRILKEYNPYALKLNVNEKARLAKQGFIAQKQTHYASDVYRGPRIRVHNMKVLGPIDTDWPPQSHKALVGNSLDPDDVDIGKALLKFANKAFRQPVKLNEIQHYIDFVEDKVQQGTNKADAIKLGLSGILISPRFLYLNNAKNNVNQDTESDVTQAKQFELANRLSYMLWRTVPDQTLITAAKNGELATRSQMWKQVDRMLLDPRANAFTTGFLNAWLRLDKLGEMPPSERQFPDYYRYRLENSMRLETEILFTYILNYNLSVTEFFKADYTFVNDGLAALYGFNNIYGENFQKVTLPQSANRKGLLGHASVLTASANGVDTSPVLRGVWILESILGTPPPPPPPDVPSIEPDTRGATTIREQLQKHRNVEACADCHADIDPWGFPLENYDPIGKYRSHYPMPRKLQKKHKPKFKIDNEGLFDDGTKITSINDMTQAILNKEAQLTRNLIVKMLTFAVGREPTFRDEAEIQEIVKVLLANGNGLKGMLKLVIASDYFNKG